MREYNEDNVNYDEIERELKERLERIRKEKELAAQTEKEKEKWKERTLELCRDFWKSPYGKEAIKKHLEK